MLASLAVLAVGAEFFAPYGLADARPHERHRPPRWAFVEARGVAHARPFAPRLELGYDEHRRREWHARMGGEAELGFFVRGKP